MSTSREIARAGHGARVVLRIASRILRILATALFVLLALVVPVPVGPRPRYVRAKQDNEAAEVVRR
jgi:hypothetical protein